MSRKLSDLRDHLFDQLEKLKSAEDPTSEINRSKAMAAISAEIINSAKLELQFIHTVGQESLPASVADPKKTGTFFEKPAKGLGTGKELGAPLQAVRAIGSK